MSLALITGATSGIGRAAAKLLAKAGYDLVVVGRRESELQSLQSELSHLKVNVSLRCADLNNLQTTDQIFLGLEKLDVLLNCAGLAKFGLVSLSSLQDDQQTVNVNCLALVQMCRRALPLMNPGATIINISSLSDEIPIPHMAVYSASKAFVTNFTLALAEEVRHQNIKVVCVSPGGVDTPFVLSAGMDESVNKNSAALLVSPEYVARAIVAAVRHPKSRIVPARSGLLLPLLIWLLPRQLLARLAGAQYKKFYNR
jgi:uncharacterized protein